MGVWQCCCPFRGGDELLWDSLVPAQPDVGIGRGGLRFGSARLGGSCLHRGNQRGFMPTVGPFPYGDAAGRWGLGPPEWELPPFSTLPRSGADCLFLGTSCPVCIPKWKAGSVPFPWGCCFTQGHLLFLAVPDYSRWVGCVMEALNPWAVTAPAFLKLHLPPLH